MSLPQSWVDRIFAKLSLVYGHDFLRRWDGLPLDQVKADWAHELSRLQQNPDAIAWALQNLPPGKAPDVLEFRALCNRRPDAAPLRLDRPRANPEIVKQCLARLQSSPLLGGSAVKGVGWAQRIVHRAERGERINQATLRMAREAIERGAEVVEEPAA